MVSKVTSIASTLVLAITTAFIGRSVFRVNFDVIEFLTSLCRQKRTLDNLSRFNFLLDPASFDLLPSHSLHEEQQATREKRHTWEKPRPLRP